MKTQGIFQFWINHYAMSVRARHRLQQIAHRRSVYSCHNHVLIYSLAQSSAYGKHDWIYFAMNQQILDDALNHIDKFRWEQIQLLLDFGAPIPLNERDRSDSQSRLKFQVLFGPVLER